VACVSGMCAGVSVRQACVLVCVCVVATLNAVKAQSQRHRALNAHDGASTVPPRCDCAFTARVAITHTHAYTYA